MGGIFSSTTHVANGYHKDVWVRVVSDQSIAKHLSLNFKPLSNVSTEVKQEYVTEFCSKEGYTKIGSGYATSFYTDASLQSAVYVSVILADPKGYFSCQNHPVQVNRSVIIDKHGYLKMAKYTIGPFGESCIWKDTEEIWHKPDKGEKSSN